ncbi:MAG: ABC transporter permease subunit [Acidimicrobiales bacterium]
MEQFLQATIFGLATAAILAVAAAGLVLTYTTTGIFNFAHGALGMLGAFTYWQLRVDWAWPAPLALLVVLGVLAPLAGVVIERVIMRGLADAPETVRVVVTISLLVALLGAGLWLWDPSEPYPLQRFWGNGSSVELAGVNVTYHEIAVMAVAVGLALGLRLLLFRTRSGIAMRAAVDDRPLSSLNGSRPDRSAMLAWAVGCSCAALSGVLMAPLIQLGHVALTLLIVNAYAAAMFGRLRSLPMTFLGAVVVGVLGSWAAEYLPEDSLILNQFRFALPAIVLFAVLVVLRQPRPRGHGLVRTRELIPRPSWAGALVTAGAFVAAGLYFGEVLTDADALAASRIVALSIIGLSLVPLVGFAGQLSLCQMSFAAIGAIVMAHHAPGGEPIGLVYATLAAAAVGALVALPAIRLGGLYLALATGAFAVILDRWILQLRPFDLGPLEIEIFTAGSLTVRRPDVPGTDTDGGLLVVLSITFALLYLLVVAIRRSTFGHRLLAMKESPAAAATLGINLTALKLSVFVLSAAMAGLGGALYAGSAQGAVSADQFAFFTSLPLLLLGVVGGIGSAAGALLAGVLLGGMPLVVAEYAWFANISRVLPGTMGIALGRNPNGVVQELREGFAPMARAPLALLVTLVSVASVLALRWVDVVSGVWFAVALGAAALSGGLLLRFGLLGGKRLAAEPLLADGAEDEDEVPLEWLGIERPYTPADVAALDRALGLESAGAR